MLYIRYLVRSLRCKERRRVTRTRAKFRHCWIHLFDSTSKIAASWPCLRILTAQQNEISLENLMEVTRNQPERPRRKKMDGYSTQHACLLVWDLNLTRIDPFNNIMWGLAIHCAANALGSSQNLLHAARKFLC